MQDIYTIKGPLSTSYLSILILVVLLIVILGFVVYILKKKEKDKKDSLQKILLKKPDVDYLKIAEEKIIRLKKRIGNEEIGILFLELSFICREYLMSRYNIGAIEMTATEIDNFLKDRDVKALYEMCYRGEFWKKKPTEKDLLSAIKAAYKVINKT